MAGFDAIANGNGFRDTGEPDADDRPVRRFPRRRGRFGPRFNRRKAIYRGRRKR